MRRLGIPVRFRHSIFLPGDEVCFLLVETSSAHLVTEAARRAAIAVERVVVIEVTVDDV